MSSLVQEKFRVMHLGDSVGTAGVAFKKSLINLVDVGNRAQETIYTKGQSCFLAPNGYMPGEANYSVAGKPRRAFDFVKTSDVLMSVDQGVVGKLSTLGVVRLSDVFETKVRVAYTAGVSLEVDSTVGLPDPGTLEIGGELRSYVVADADTITLDPALAEDYAVGAVVKFHKFAVLATLSANAAAAAVTLTVTSQAAIAVGTTPVTIKIGSETFTGGTVTSATVLTLGAALVSAYAAGTRVFVYVP